VIEYMKKTIFGCTMLIIATMFILKNAYLISGITYFVGFIFVAWGAIPKVDSKS
jgi:hypothetical protein